MVTVDYFGRSGNQIFQYVFARVLCMEFNHWIYTPQPKVFLPMKPFYPECEEIRGWTKMIGDYNVEGYLNAAKDAHPEGETHLHLHGYFQKSWFYNPYRTEIRDMFDLKQQSVNYDDIVIHLRLTDYFWHRVNSVISPEWYIDIVKGQQYEKCYVVVEDHPTNRRYLNMILNSIKSSYLITGGNILDEFNFIRSFDRIVCSNSTFCWWAAFLSNATKIWTFKPWMNKVGGKYMPDLAGISGAIEADGKFYTDRELAGRDWTDYWNR